MQRHSVNAMVVQCPEPKQEKILVKILMNNNLCKLSVGYFSDLRFVFAGHNLAAKYNVLHPSCASYFAHVKGLGLHGELAHYQ